MALAKSDNSGSNVTNLDDARKSRANSPSEIDRKDSNNGGPDDKSQSAQPSKIADSDASNPAKAKRKVGNRRFDTVKVERIKAEIARGEYKIDSLHVADKFIEHERYS